jgi:hypothetical protein
MPFQVTPFEPFLTRYEKPGTQVTADPNKADLAKEQTPAPAAPTAPAAQ